MRLSTCRVGYVLNQVSISACIYLSDSSSIAFPTRCLYGIGRDSEGLASVVKVEHTCPLIEILGCSNLMIALLAHVYKLTFLILNLPRVKGNSPARAARVYESDFKKQNENSRSDSGLGDEFCGRLKHGVPFRLIVC